MKGVVLAGGTGSRFLPLTKVVNKHLLDVYDEPMIHFPIRTLVRSGVDDIVVVTGDEITSFRRLLGDGSSLGAKLTYAYQDGATGIADALGRAESLVRGESVCVILGDNIFQEDLSPFVRRFVEQDKGAKVLLKQVAPDDARRFGVAEVAGGGIVGIEEKPANPRSDLVVTGCYFFDARAFDFIRVLRPSGRGELEVTDLNNLYIEEGTMSYEVLAGWWTDAGTPASKLKASMMVALEKGVAFHR